VRWLVGEEVRYFLGEDRTSRKKKKKKRKRQNIKMRALWVGIFLLLLFLLFSFIFFSFTYHCSSFPHSTPSSPPQQLPIHNYLLVTYYIQCYIYPIHEREREGKNEGTNILYILFMAHSCRHQIKCTYTK